MKNKKRKRPVYSIDEKGKKTYYESCAQAQMRYNFKVHCYLQNQNRSDKYGRFWRYNDVDNVEEFTK